MLWPWMSCLIVSGLHFLLLYNSISNSGDGKSKQNHMLKLLQKDALEQWSQNWLINFHQWKLWAGTFNMCIRTFNQFTLNIKLNFSRKNRNVNIFSVYHWIIFYIPWGAYIPTSRDHFSRKSRTTTIVKFNCLVSELLLLSYKPVKMKKFKTILTLGQELRA